jgi:hypothetical protein
VAEGYYSTFFYEPRNQLTMGSKRPHLTRKHQVAAARHARGFRGLGGDKLRGVDDETRSQAEVIIGQYNQGRTLKIIEQAKYQQLKRKKEEGLLVDRADVEAALNTSDTVFRAALSRATGYLSSDLTPVEREHCEFAMRAAIQRALADAAQQFHDLRVKLENSSGHR